MHEQMVPAFGYNVTSSPLPERAVRTIELISMDKFFHVAVLWCACYRSGVQFLEGAYELFRKRKRNPFTRHIFPTHGNNDVLASFMHIRHRGATRAPW